MKDLFKDYKKIMLGELNENTRHFIFDFLGQAMLEDFLYEYKGRLYKITDIERINDTCLNVEFIEADEEQDDNKFMPDILPNIPGFDYDYNDYKQDTHEPRFLRKHKTKSTLLK